VNGEAIIWTEGKTDWQHLKHAFQKLGAGSQFDFEEFTGDWGDDRLFGQCIALARVRQLRPTIFIFDRDNEGLIAKIEDSDRGYKSWGNNVYSLALPVPTHRSAEPAISIEFYYTDAELRTPDAAGRRLYLSSEFDPSSGRHRVAPRLSIGNKYRLSAKGSSIRIVDCEVYDEHGQNVALSKADFAERVVAGTGAFANFLFDSFTLILTAAELIVEDAREVVDLTFGDLPAFLADIERKDPTLAFVAVVSASIQLCKLMLMTFIGVTVRHYEHRVSEPLTADAKKVRPIKQALEANLTQPTLANLQKLARHCYHLIDDGAPTVLCSVRAALAMTPVLGAVGDLFDQLELAIPPPPRQVKTLNRSRLPKPILEYVLSEFAKYEGRLSEIAEASISPSPLAVDSRAVWGAALSTLSEWFVILSSLTFRLRAVERVVTNSDEFRVKLTTFWNERKEVSTVVEVRGDLTADRLQTSELVLSAADGGASLDLFPFIAIDQDRLHFYNRTRAAGYEYAAPFSDTGLLIPTKRKFNHSALRSTLGMQGLFWAQVEPTTSAAGVKANIPTEGRIVGRKQQLATIVAEIIRIPNQNGIIYGPGGVGKTALLVELSRQLCDEPTVDGVRFRNIIWVSAKRDYYEPSIDEVEKREPQFASLDNILTAILEFHEWEDAESYDLENKKWLVLGLLEEQPTLLVLDNFESVKRAEQDEIIRFFGIDAKVALRNKPDYLKVLVTSREVIPSGFHQVKLKGLDKRESKRLMTNLYEIYANSGTPQLEDEQRDQLYEATQGIPLLIKHCYAQIYEFGRAPHVVFAGLLSAPSNAVDFSFAEIFKLLKQDDLLLRAILLLEVSGRPLMQRQMADILGAEEEPISQALTRLSNFQCVSRSSSGLDDKYAVNPEARFLAKRLTQEYGPLATEMKRRIAGLALEKRLDYTKEEFAAVLVLQEYVAQGHYLMAEDHMRAELKRRPDSIVLNLHYAKYLHDVKRSTEDAIELLEKIRVASGNDQQVLRLLMTYYSTLPIPNFEQANTYAQELAELAESSTDIELELARFYVHWSTSIKIKFEGDPIQEMLRQQKYKDLAQQAIKLLSDLRLHTSEWNQLLAQSYYNIWSYESALRHANAALERLPAGSHLVAPYRRLRGEILKRLHPRRRDED
jgi:hypothetical protein